VSRLLYLNPELGVEFPENISKLGLLDPGRGGFKFLRSSLLLLSIYELIPFLSPNSICSLNIFELILNYAAILLELTDPGAVISDFMSLDTSFVMSSEGAPKIW